MKTKGTNIVATLVAVGNNKLNLLILALCVIICLTGCGQRACRGKIVGGQRGQKVLVGHNVTQGVVNVHLRVPRSLGLSADVVQPVNDRAKEMALNGATEEDIRQFVHSELGNEVLVEVTRRDTGSRYVPIPQGSSGQMMEMGGGVQVERGMSRSNGPRFNVGAQVRLPMPAPHRGHPTVNVSYLGGNDHQCNEYCDGGQHFNGRPQFDRGFPGFRNQGGSGQVFVVESRSGNNALTMNPSDYYREAQRQGVGMYITDPSVARRASMPDRRY